MTCKFYANGACVADLNNIHQCGFVSVGEGCSVCAAESASYATFRQMVEVYQACSDATLSRMNDARTVAERFAVLLNKTLDDKADLNKNDYQLIVQRLLNGDHPFVDHRTNTKISGAYELATIKKWMMIWRVMCGQGESKLGEEMRKRYEKLKVRTTSVDLIPKIRVPHKEVRELTDKEAKTLSDRIVMLRNSKSEKERKLGLFLDIAIETGARTSDVAHAKWGWFKQHGDEWEYSFTPSKTKKHGVIQCGRLSPYFVASIVDIKGADDEEIFKTTDGRAKNGKTTTGLFSGKKLTIINNACREIRKIVPDGHAAVYLLRRLKSKRVTESDGFITEAKALGHSMMIAMRHYYNVNKMKFKEGVVR